GFGDLNGEFWLGLHKMHEITSDPHVDYQIQIEFYKSQGDRLVSSADNFRIAAEGAAYRVTHKGNSLFSSGRAFRSRGPEIEDVHPCVLSQNSWW
ncbi:hypothetical protein CAPTEDRAFT_68472, partial [Capitella teleta]